MWKQLNEVERFIIKSLEFDKPSSTDEELQVINNYGKHNPKSSLLIGKLNEDDIIMVKKIKTYKR